MSEIHGAVGSYVVNALDADELEEFEAHLASCATCSREVVEFCETAAQLWLLASSSGPPPMLRSSVLAQISQVRPLPPELPEEAPTTAEAGGPRRAMVPVARPAEPAQPVDELARRRQRRRTRLLTLAVAAVSVLALSLGIGVVNMVQNRQAQVAAADVETRLEAQLYTAPDVKIVPATTVNGAQVSFVSSKSLNKALFVNNNLPSPGDRLTYQLWTLKGRDATADNLIDAGLRRQWFKNSIADSTGLAVTIEPETGSVVPTTPVQANAAI
jgi:hypothetical protein